MPTSSCREARRAPDVVCLAWREELSGQTFRLWRDQLDDAPPYRTDDACAVRLLRRQCRAALPSRTRLATAGQRARPQRRFRCVTNGRTMPAGKGLLGALAYYGFNDTDCKRKDAMQKRIMQGWPFTRRGA